MEGLTTLIDIDAANLEHNLTRVFSATFSSSIVLVLVGIGEYTPRGISGAAETMACSCRDLDRISASLEDAHYALLQAKKLGVVLPIPGGDGFLSRHLWELACLSALRNALDTAAGLFECAVLRSSLR
jgi:hypothetical protein